VATDGRPTSEFTDNFAASLRMFEPTDVEIAFVAASAI